MRKLNVLESVSLDGVIQAPGGTEKLRYIHRNPVTCGLVDRPEHWLWSTFRHYLTGEHCGVEVESRWTAQARERLGIFPTAQNRKEKPRPSGA